MRTAIYARMSTDKQSETSPEDQIARCREFAQARGWVVVEDLVIAEAGIIGEGPAGHASGSARSVRSQARDRLSGASRHNRRATRRAPGR